MSEGAGPGGGPEHVVGRIGLRWHRVIKAKGDGGEVGADAEGKIRKDRAAGTALPCSVSSC
eukprot:762969-Hanusia_phi.AAC.5